jgi:hypothetical protein
MRNEDYDGTRHGDREARGRAGHLPAAGQTGRVTVVVQETMVQEAVVPVGSD